MPTFICASCHIVVQHAPNLYVYYCKWCGQAIHSDDRTPKKPNCWMVVTETDLNPMSYTKIKYAAICLDCYRGED